MEKSDIRQRRLYAEGRMFIAIDRFLGAQTDSERKMARKWAYAWRDFSKGRHRDGVCAPDLSHP